MSDIKDRVKRATSIVKKVNEYLKSPMYREGNHYKCLCPLHNENTASFAIYEDTGSFYCYGCRESGDVIDFIQKKEGLSFYEVIKKLAKENNIEYNFDNNYHNRLDKVYEDLVDHYRGNIKLIDYLEKRGLSNKVIETFRLGYAVDNRGIDYLLSKGYTLKDLTIIGITTRGLDRNRNRLTIPIINRNQKIISISNRRINETDSPKYMNTPNSEKENTLYNENNLVRGKPILLVEGYFDVITTYANVGDKYNILGLMGTVISYKHIFYLKSNTRDLYIILDNDTAGNLALERNIDKLLFFKEKNNNLRIGILPNKLDPDEYIRKGGDIERILSNSIDIREWVLNKINEKKFKLKDILDLILDIDIRKEYYKYIVNNLKPIKEIKYILKEEQILVCLFKYPEVLEELLEEISLISFKDIELEEIRLKIIKNYIDNYGDTKGITTNIIAREKLREKIETIKNNFNIGGNKEIIILYIKDILSI